MVVAACCVSGQGQAPPPDKKDIVKQVFDAWKARRTKVKAVRYKVSGETIVPKGSLPATDDVGRPQAGGSALPKSDVSCPKTVTMLLDFVEQRFRYERAEKYYHSDSNSLKERESTWTFTGK